MFRISIHSCNASWLGIIFTIIALHCTVSSIWGATTLAPVSEAVRQGTNGAAGPLGNAQPGGSGQSAPNTPWSTGSIDLDAGTFGGNQAIGGAGGTGGQGDLTTDNGRKGGAGGSGGNAYGGIGYASGSVNAGSQIVLEDNTAQAGSGGTGGGGGSGMGTGNGASGGKGGQGGNARGGALGTDADITITGGGVITGNKAAGGHGGDGGTTGNRNPGNASSSRQYGAGGGNGGSAQGGALYSGGLTILNGAAVVFSKNTALGGNAGAGMDGGTKSSAPVSGNGGSAQGGSVYAASGLVLDADTSVLYSRALGGAGGNAGHVLTVVPADAITAGIAGGNGGEAAGGGAYSGSNVSGNGVLFFDTAAAIGGAGGNGGSAAGSNSTTFSGAGGSGGKAKGGAVYGAALSLGGMFVNSLALGGAGGNGGCGEPAFDASVTSNGVRGGSGGAGGEAAGGALYATGNLDLGFTTLRANQARGGAGGNGGTGGAASGTGNGGQGGNGGAGGAALGGGAYAGTLTAAGGVIADNQAVGGRGGNGAESGTAGPNNGSSQVAGDGGAGGAASGGGLYASGTVSTGGVLRFSGNRAVGGSGGDGAYAPGSSSSGSNSSGGNGGTASGGSLYAGGLLTLGAQTFFDNSLAAGGGGGFANESDQGGSIGGMGGAAWGGSIFSDGLSFAGALTVANSRAVGGNGGQAHSDGKQNVGGTGGNAFGGAIYSSDAVNGAAPASFSNVFALGGAGEPSSKGGRRKDGGNGGLGGNASGGAVYAVQAISLNGLVVNNAGAVGGDGGSGGKGGNPDKDPGLTGPGVGGTGGSGGTAAGGALYSAASGTSLSNAVISNASALGGAGGNGGAGNEGGEYYAASSGGNGGNGGDAFGGAVYSGGNVTAVDSVFIGNRALGGSGGNGGKDNGGGRGAEGIAGRGYGGALYIKGTAASLQNVFFISNTAGTAGGAVFMEVAGADVALGLSADSGKQSVFQGNSAGAWASGIAFGATSGTASGNIDLNFSGNGDIYLHDPVSATTTGTFTATKTGSGVLAWGGQNVLTTSANTINLNDGTTRLLHGFSLQGSPVAINVNGASTVLRLEQGSPMVLQTGSSLAMGAGTTLSIELGSRDSGSAVFSTSGGNLSFSNNSVYLTWNPIKPLNDIAGSWQMVDGAYSGAYQYMDNNAQLTISGDGTISGYYASPYNVFYNTASANGKRVWHALNEYMGRHPEIALTGGSGTIAMYAAAVSGMTPEMYANQGRQALLAQGRTAEQALALAFGANGQTAGADPASVASMTHLAGDMPHSRPYGALQNGQERYDSLAARRRQMENTPLSAALNQMRSVSQLGRTGLSSEHDHDEKEPFLAGGQGYSLGGVRFFSGLTGNLMHRNGGGDYGGYRYTSGGLLAGLALSIAPGWEAGGYAGFSRGHMEDADTDSHSAVDGAHFGLFARFVHASGFKATTDLAYGHFWNYGTRKFFLGPSEQRYENKYQQDLLGLGLELAYDLEIAEHTRLTPYVGARYTHLWQDDFKEKAKGGSVADLALHTDAARADSFRSTAGLRLARDFQASEHIVVTPSALVGWLHEWADKDMDLTSTLAGTGPAFSTRSASESRDELRLGLGLDTVFNLYDKYDLGIRAGYAVDLRAESQDHGVFLNMELSF